MRARRIMMVLPLLWLAMSLPASAQEPTKEEKKHNPALICPVCRRVNGDVTTPYGQKAGLTLTVDCPPLPGAIHVDRTQGRSDSSVKSSSHHHLTLLHVEVHPR